MDANSKKPNYGSQGSFAKLQLKGAEDGKVVTRFPPENSGFLHVGHLKAILLNDYYRNIYHGKMILRFDDTNPANGKEEYTQAIIHDLQSINVNPNQITFTSDYFDLIIEKTKELIQSGNAYIDDTDQEIIKDQRRNMIESQCRNLSVDENLRRYNEMLLGSDFGKKCVVRAKINMKDVNGALRDPALARCVDEPHARTGTKYKCYPTYDLAIVIVDSIEGVTHAMRDSQYHDRLPLYYWVQEKLNLRKVYIQEFSRINFQFTVMSKRKMNYFVEQGLVDGWDDPALPTIKGILNRGLSIDVLKDFILSQGASKSMTNMTMHKLWNANKKVIDPIVPRYITVTENCYHVTIIESGGIDYYSTCQLHPKNNDLGTKIVRHSNTILIDEEDGKILEINEEFTLFNWGNAIVKTKDHINKTMEIKLNLGGDPKSTKNKITWIAKDDHNPKVILTTIGHLITVPSLPSKKNGDTTDWKTLINPNLKTRVKCFGENDMTDLKKGTRLQIMRKGYFIVHKVDNNCIELVDIPDGREV